MVVYKAVNQMEIEEIKTQAMLHGAKREDLDKAENEPVEASPMTLDNIGMGKPKGRHYKKKGKL